MTLHYKVICRACVNQEQLGLKLDAERETVDVLVIDRIERPSEH